MLKRAVLMGTLLASVAFVHESAKAQSKPSAQQVARGKYLASFGGCMDCHTPGYFFGKPDMARHLAGSEVGFEVPGLGIFHGPNLTPDKETGLGGWTDQQIMTPCRKACGQTDARWHPSCRGARWPISPLRMRRRSWPTCAAFRR
jgi:mono/diheme cytochrome c family protein